jgi:acid phosphatase
MNSWKKLGLVLLFFCLSTCASARVPPVDPAPSPPTAVEHPLSNPTTLQFFTFGDWGIGDAKQMAVAQALRDFCAKEVCDFGLLLGDNFYDFGVTSVDDPLWDSRFEQMYQGLDLPFYAALGNHDHQGNIQAQIDYSNQPGQTRWKLPGRQYTARFGETDANPLIEIFVLDSETYSANDATQLREDLNESQARWKFLAMHHPIYSNGSHGDTDYLIDFVLPIICQKVDVVLVGHDHLFSHLFDPTDGCNIQHFVVGTGGKTIYSSHPDPRVLFTLSDFGFATLEVTEEKIHLEFHKTDGSIPYEYTLQK